MSRLTAIVRMPVIRPVPPAPPALYKPIGQHPLYTTDEPGVVRAAETTNEKGGGTSGRPPSAVSAGDIRELVQLLKRKPAGIRITRELLETHKRIFELRKIPAYENLSLISNEDQLIKLSDLGWQFAARLRAETVMFRALLLNNRAHRAALDWVSENRLKLITSEEISQFWRKTLEPVRPAETDESLKESAVTFFHLCQAADLGTMILGKRGRITRLLIDRRELEQFLAKGYQDHNNPEPAKWTVEQVFPGHDPALPDFGKTDVLLISKGNNSVADQVKAAFELAGLSHRTLSVEECKNDNWISNNDFHLFEESLFGCFILGENEAEKLSDGRWRLKDSVLCELGAAFFGFHSRLTVVSTIDLELPERLSALAHFQISGRELSWPTARRLVDQIKTAKQQSAEGKGN